MRRSSVFVFLGLATLLLGALCLGAGPEEGAGGAPGDRDAPPAWSAPEADRLVEGLVMGVIDGDSLTLLVDGRLRRFEVLGADAPEWVEKASRPRHYSGEARLFVGNMLLGERVGVFEPEPGTTDPLGRRRGHVFRLPDMAFVDLEIVRQGYGKVGTRTDEGFRPVLDWYEDRARQADRGMWGLRPVEPEPDESGTENLGPDAEPPASGERLVDENPKPEPTPASQEPSQWVWVTRSGSKYHREDCAHLSQSRTRVRREDIRSTHEACKSCDPDD